MSCPRKSPRRSRARWAIPSPARTATRSPAISRTTTPIHIPDPALCASGIAQFAPDFPLHFLRLVEELEFRARRECLDDGARLAGVAAEIDREAARDAEVGCECLRGGCPRTGDRPDASA